jgi:Ca2+-binding EF-hand superfamily protein
MILFSLLTLVSMVVSSRGTSNCDYCADSYISKVCCDNKVSYDNLCYAKCGGITDPKKACVYGPCSNDKNGDIDILLDHTDYDIDNNIISYKEEEILLNLFNKYDADNTELLCYDEFGLFIKEIFKFDAAFDRMDINEDGKLDYAEFVYAFKQFNKINAKNDNVLEVSGVDEMKQMLESELPDNTEYTEEVQAELEVNLVFYEIDTNNNNYIAKDEFSKYQVDIEWFQLKSSYNGKLDFNEFRNEFFDNQYFKTYQNARKNSDKFNEFRYILETAHSNSNQVIENVNKQIVFGCHELDDVISKYDNNAKRRRTLAAAIIAAIISGVASIAVSAGDAASAHACYYDHGTVYKLNYGEMYLKDVAIGDYVFDGNQFTKIFHIQEYENIVTDMIQIKFGIDQSVVVTPKHLLYVNDQLVTAENIKIGDLLSDGSYNDNDNYTVHDIEFLYNLHPINPITFSGNLAVNGIKTSVFSHSVNEHIRLQKYGAIFRFISRNVNERLASDLLSFYYNVIYKKLLNEQVRSMIFDDSTFIGYLFIISIPIIIAVALIKSFNAFDHYKKIN